LYKINEIDFEEEKNFEKDQSQLLTLDLEGFNGPLDLLLQLAQQKKLDITKISILSLVNQYLKFIKKMKKMNLDLASDYLVMAAILAYIKSKLLLPINESLSEKEQETLPELLAFNLKRLKAMRDTSQALFSKKLLGSERFLKGHLLDQAVVLETEFYCNKSNLLVCFSNIFNRKNNKTMSLETFNYYNIERAIDKIKNLYQSIKDWFSISLTLPKVKELGKTKYSMKVAYITTIAASLELVKREEIFIKQNEDCGEIFIKKR